MIGLSAIEVSRIWKHEGFQRYFRNTSWMFIGQAASIISLVVNIWLARYLGPEHYGLLSYAIAFGGLFAFISTLGITDILVRDLVRYPEKRGAYMGTSASLLAGGGALAFVCTTIAAFLFESDGLLRALIMIYSLIFFFSPSNVITAFFQARVESKKNAVVQIGMVVMVSLVKIALILSGKGIIWLTFAFVLDYVFATFLYILQYKASALRFSEWTFDLQIAKHILRSAALLMFSSAVGYLLFRIDQVMLKQYLDATSVGLYAAAIRLAELWYFIPAIVSVSLFPAILHAKERDPKLYFSRLQKLVFFLAASSCVLAIVISFLAPLLIDLLYGSAYAASVPVLQLYIWSSVGLFLNMGLTKYLLAEDRLVAILNLNLIAMTSNIVLNMILIPQLGLTGAAWATLISYTVSPIIALMLLRQDHTLIRVMD